MVEGVPLHPSLSLHPQVTVAAGAGEALVQVGEEVDAGADLEAVRHRHEPVEVPLEQRPVEPDPPLHHAERAEPVLAGPA